MNRKINKKKSRKVYVVAGYTPWSRKIFKERISKYPGKWHLISERKDMTKNKIKKITPEYIFFLHWSWKISEEIVNNYECVCFHMTDVPYGRGGSPLQNLIIRGHKKTKLTALKMIEKFDAGPVYLKENLLLSGRAEEIYERASNLIAKMILKMIRQKIKPKSQKGKPTIFKRRKPEESEIPQCQNIKEFYDFIRMLDAETYPKAFIIYKGFILEFFKPILRRNSVSAEVKIKKEKKYDKRSKK